MTIEDFNSLRKGSKVYSISTISYCVYEYEVLQRKNEKVIAESYHGKYTFKLNDAIFYNFFLKKDMVKMLRNTSSEDLKIILHNKLNSKIIEPFKRDLVEYFI